MSKWSAPAPEGEPTHPTKIIVRGAKGAAREDALAKYGGQIRHFHAAQQQQVGLSGQAQYQANNQWGPVSVTYQNNNGQERLVINIAEGGSSEEEETTSDAYWQWAILETTIPDMTLTSAEMSAFMEPKPKGKIGVAWDNVYNHDENNRPPLSYPDTFNATFIEEIAGQTEQVSSLLVDLRDFPGGVKFDLYGFIHPYDDPDPTKLGPVKASTYRASNVALSITQDMYSDTWTSTSGLTGKFMSPGDISGRQSPEVRYRFTTPALVNADFPETVGLSFFNTSTTSPYGAFGASGEAYSGSSHTWGSDANMPQVGSKVGALISAAGGLFSETTTYYAGGFIKMVRGLGAVTYYQNASTGFQSVSLNGGGPQAALKNWGILFFDYKRFFTSTRDPLKVYPSRDAPLRFAVFDSATPDGYTLLQSVSGGFGNRRRWEDRKRASRWKFLLLESMSIPGQDPPENPTLENHLGMVRLGTVIINPRKGKGGIGFKPA